MNLCRYYSYYQFFTVILIIFLAVFFAMSIIYSYYKNSNKKNIAIRYFIFSIIAIFIIIKIVESVIINFEVASILRNIQASIFIFLIYLLSYYIFVREYKLIKVNEKAEKIILGVAFFLLAISLKNKCLLDDYAFNKVSYSNKYIDLIYLNVVIDVFFILKYACFSKQLNIIYNNKTSAVFISVLMIPPLLIYILLASVNNVYIDFMEIVIYYIFCFFMYLGARVNGDDGITLIAFNKIGDMCTDSIFVLDENGNIIYKNKAVKDSLLFSDIEKIDNNEIKKLFNGELSVKSNHLGKDYLMLKKDKSKYYFTYKMAELKETDKTLGHIITITEISELMKLLFTLEEKKKKSKNINSQLTNHSKVVYHVEREKELNNLLDEIINSREEQMECLAQMINKIKEEKNEQSFEEDIDKAIIKSNKILSEVRATVSMYREHFGG